MEEAQRPKSDLFFTVKLELFEGPIDLLLHLVKQNELPLEKLALAEVTEQYLDCIKDLGQIDLELAGEYVLIAATLVSIKSSLLLNEPVELILDEHGDLIDPHDELLKKLREAQIYKEGAKMLSECDKLGIDVFSTPSSMKEVGSAEAEYRPHDPILLGQAFRKMLLELDDAERLYTIELEAVSIVERMRTVLETLNREQKLVPFRDLVSDPTSRSSIIGTFCALLELCKRQVIEVVQEKACGDIGIQLATLDLDISEVTSAIQTSEFDTDENAVVHG